MLRINPVRSAADAKKYYSASDYYSDGQETVGRWGGRLANMLQLSGTVDQARFDQLCDNINPMTGDRLTQRTVDNRKVAYDLTFSGPKSFSIVEALASEVERKALLAAFDASVTETMTDIEADMRCRVRADGQDTDRVTGNMVWAEFDHSTARPVDSHTPPDMHRHKHVVAFNAVWDPVEGKMKAGQFGELKHDGEYYTALFYARLTAKLEALGYRIDRRGGKDWEIAGIPQSMIDTYSKRTEQVEAEAARLGITDIDQKAELGATTRGRKQKELTPAELRIAWYAQLTDSERDALARVYAREIEAGQAITAEQAVGFALDHCSEQQSVIPERELKRVALLFGLGSLMPEEIDRELGAPANGLIVREIDGRRLATTKALQAEERFIIGVAGRGLGGVRPVGVPEGLERGRLNDGQWQAVTGLLNSDCRVNAVLGPAGAGKTDLLKAYASGMALAGKPVAFFATSSDAVGVLQRDGFEEARTVAHLLLDERLQQSLRGGHIVVDESGLLGHRDAYRLFALAEKLDLKVTLVGDPQQHGSVSRGAFLRVLTEHGGVKPFRLGEIMRQKQAEDGRYQEAAKQLSEGRTLEGYNTLDGMGWVKELGDDAERVRAIASDYVQALADKKSVLVVSPTHREGAAITSEIRAQLKAAGKIGAEDHAVTRLEAINASEAQRRQTDTYRNEPLVLVFHQNAKGFKKGERLTVNDPTKVPLNFADRFSLYRPVEDVLAVGDVLRFTANVKAMGGAHTYKNGQTRTVSEITPGGNIRLDDGRVIAADAGHWRHGRVETSFGSQGRTVQRVILGMSSDSAAAMNQEQMYVSASRAKERVTLYTDDREAVRSAIQKSSQKLAALDLGEGDRPRQIELGRLRRHLERQRRVARSYPKRPVGQLPKHHVTEREASHGR